MSVIWEKGVVCFYFALKLSSEVQIFQSLSIVNIIEICLEWGIGSLEKVLTVRPKTSVCGLVES